MNMALQNLMGDVSVDSTEYINISDLDSPPVITFCPRQPINMRKLFEWGWMSGSGFIVLRINADLLMQGILSQVKS